MGVLGFLEDRYNGAVDLGVDAIDLGNDAWKLSKRTAKAAVSVGGDIVSGADRTIEGLNFLDRERQAEIGLENELIAGLLKRAFVTAIQNGTNPLNLLVSVTVGAYVVHVPDSALAALTKDVGAKVLPHVAGRVLGKKLATMIVARVLNRVAATMLFKNLARNFGLAAGAAGTGVGIPVSLLILQGAAQKASAASHRMLRIDPELHRELRRQGGLDLLYFVAENELRPYVNGIALARKNPKLFDAIINASLKFSEGAAAK